jgi:hypothetical protein
MAQIVIEFGAPTFDPVINALLSVIGTPTTIEIEYPSNERQSCPATKEFMEIVSGKLTDGRLVSVTIRTDCEDIRYGLISRPDSGGYFRSMWMGTVEVTTEDWRRYWDALLRFESLAFVCVGDEEGVELTDENLTVDSFPWDEWPILVGALRAGDGETGWVVRERKPPSIQ